jgi:hypothetical protein
MLLQLGQIPLLKNGFELHFISASIWYRYCTHVFGVSLHFTTFHYMSLPYAKVKDLGIPSAMETELRAPRSR